MIVGNVQIPETAFEEYFAASAEQLLSGADPLYAQMDEQAARARSQVQNLKRELSVGLMPVAYFGIRSAIEVAQRPEIASQLPADVLKRSRMLRACSIAMIGAGVHRGTFTQHYEGSDALRPVLYENKGAVGSLFSAKVPEAAAGLGLLVEVAIMDEAIVAGGALRFLKRKHGNRLHEESAAAIVGRSVGLQLVARVHDDALEEMRLHLGMPYVKPQYLRFINDSLDFTPEARAFLHGLMTGAGCPAHAALTEGKGHAPTFLRLIWSDLAKVLLPSNATADMPPARLVKKRR